MKHVFLIGAHTPFLTSLGVISKLNLTKEDVIFVFGRNYKCDIIKNDYLSFDISDKYYIYYKNNTRKNIREHIKWLDNFIDNNICDNYCLYIPHLQFSTFQVFATHPLCIDVKFIQEGIVDFCVPEGTKVKYSCVDIYIRGWLLRGTRLWKVAGWNYPSKLNFNISETFAVNEKLFHLMNCKHTVVQWPIVDAGIQIEKDSTIFVFESAVERKDIEKDNYIASTRLLVEKYGRTNNYIKFHPYQTKENKEEILSIFNDRKLNTLILPDNIPFELILCSKEKYRVCGFTTSLIYYAQLLGHEAHICGVTLLSSNKFQKYWNSFSSQLNSCYGDIFKNEDLNK